MLHMLDTAIVTPLTIKHVRLHSTVYYSHYYLHIILLDYLSERKAAAVAPHVV